MQCIVEFWLCVCTNLQVVCLYEFEVVCLYEFAIGVCTNSQFNKPATKSVYKLAL